ncbi:hypothetical protein BGZ72_005166 [Mortierella alpina]|nr:hypothetical protein BGZ72_005166 [Mortierella alpina]
MVSTTTGIIALLSAGIWLDGWSRESYSNGRFERLVANNDASLYNRFEDQCILRPHAVALVFEGQSWTWRDLELASNRMAHWYQSKGIAPKDRVAIFMLNSPQFVISWLALLKIKAVAAFINNQISGPVLIHSLKTADARLLVFDYELLSALKESNAAIRDMGYSLYTITPREHVSELAQGQEDHLFEFMDWRQLSAEGFPRESRRDVVIGDAVALIYTSGTTGFPKAAVMDHGRCTLAASVWVGICKITEKDRSYNCLPLYHSAGAILGIGQSWISGCPVVLARKFSTTTFWRDIREQEVTLFQYIGELCRYLVNAPLDPLDRDHKIRLMFGNGLRPDVWRKFQDRFGVKTVFEAYTMSEATSALFNITSGEDGAGAVGFRGPLIRRFQPGLRIVKIDLDTEELIRDKDGFCIECAPGETGELITLADNKTSETRYIGYYNQPKLSNDKLIQNAFVQGDQYMKTGDLLYQKDGFWYFADRAGDTFRWKGENVSTAEVADTLGHVEGIASCTVYGVKIPGQQDGRAGMAAIVLKDEYWVQDPTGQRQERDVPALALNEKALEEFIDRLSAHASKRLPSYAVPRFIRIRAEELDITGTFKNKKVELKKEGFDLTKVHERLFWWTSQGRYRPFGAKENEVLMAGRARL